jgi:uncharacterized membrane protein
MIYIHNVYFGKKIIAAAKQRNIDGLKRIRKRSRLVSLANLFLMTVILLLAVFMQIPV